MPSLCCSSPAAAGKPVVSLPAGPINHHWTQNLIASPDGNTLYVTVGPNSNVGECGSWNRKPRGGYKVVFVPFSLGKPNGRPLDVLTGFVSSGCDTNGRPSALPSIGQARYWSRTMSGM